MFVSVPQARCVHQNSVCENDAMRRWLTKTLIPPTPRSRWYNGMRAGWPGGLTASACLLGWLALVLGGCRGIAGNADPRVASPLIDLAQSPSTGPPTSSALTSDDLFSIYQGILTGAVQRAEPAELVRAAIKGAHEAAVSQGLF